MAELADSFSKYATEASDGTLHLAPEHLEDVLESLGIPGDLATQLLPLMDPENEGWIGMDSFCDIAPEVMGMTRDEAKSMAEALNVIEGEYADDGVSLPTESNSEGGGFDPEDFDTDEEFVPESSDGYKSEDESESSSLRDHIYGQVSDRSGRITVDSLRKVATTLKLEVSNADLRDMVQMTGNKRGFRNVWNALGTRQCDQQ